ncbi:DUF7146 domain-containing protein [Thiomicrospira sp.]|uniref:DUF7146 domain-containing protein n=1 Tax=Thiomicrospira sp. TaxID=935 RepID=UPI002F9221AF
MNFKEATERLRGQYDAFAVAFAPQLRDVIFAPKNRKMTCPVHGVAQKFNVHPKFAVNGKWYSYIDQDVPHGVFNLLMWATGATTQEVLEFAKQYLDGSNPVSQAEIIQRETQAKAKQEQEWAENAKRNNAIWKASRNAEIELAKYLRVQRGITNAALPQNVVFNSAVFYRDFETNTTGKSPALLVKVDQPSGKAVALHRIFLDANCKKSSLGKKMLPPSGNVMGAAARLYPVVNGVLGIAEGVETAVAVTTFFGIPTWSAISAPMLSAFVFPENIHTLVIWVDKDRSGDGELYAKKLEQRALDAGLKVIYMLPPGDIPDGSKGIDWLDVCYPVN